jgi:hypothetical protein
VVAVLDCLDVAVGEQHLGAVLWAVHAEHDLILDSSPPRDEWQECP